MAKRKEADPSTLLFEKWQMMGLVGLFDQADETTDTQAAPEGARDTEDGREQR